CLSETRFTEASWLRFDLAIHMQVQWKQKKAGVFSHSPCNDNRSDEQRSRGRERWHRAVLGACAQTEINRAHERDHNRRFQKFSPFLAIKKESEPNDWKDQA